MYIIFSFEARLLTENKKLETVVQHNYAFSSQNLVIYYESESNISDCLFYCYKWKKKYATTRVKGDVQRNMFRMYLWFI